MTPDEQKPTSETDSHQWQEPLKWVFFGMVRHNFVVPFVTGRFWDSPRVMEGAGRSPSLGSVPHSRDRESPHFISVVAGRAATALTIASRHGSPTTQPAAAPTHRLRAGPRSGANGEVLVHIRRLLARGVPHAPRARSRLM